MNSLLMVSLPRDRTRTGTIELWPAAVFTVPLPATPAPAEPLKPRLNAGPFACLGKSDNEAAIDAGNPSRDPLRPFGDFPLGEYSGQLVELPSPPGPVFEREYGPYGYIVLTAVAGDALQAQKNGRYGIRVHAGDPYPSGGLRPTHGCLRLSNADFLELRQAIEALGPQALTLQATEPPEAPLGS
jgi:hypothetical protein